MYHFVRLCAAPTLAAQLTAKLKMIKASKQNTQKNESISKILKNKLRDEEKISAASEVRMSLLKAMQQQQLPAETENGAV